MEKLKRFFSDIMTLEINVVYREWYGNEEEWISKSTIDDDIIDYVKNNYPCYHPRLISLTHFSLIGRILHPLIWKKINQLNEWRLKQNESKEKD